ncbi:hypothetical protein [Anaerorhabdus sp.]|uniref:hypothetical protein n=1 Tax=Anaerorhabdus sp. TaxID=1872524 RepID=UPI002B20648E|nr:hypothetical protein [Anaerorhabdus sp.]MEA4876028.1 hypothetical protein [Anaerorhabdus sp.]
MTTIGARIELDGEREFRQQIRDATQGVKLLDSELKLNSTTFKDSKDKMNLMKDSSAILNNQIDLQRKKIILLKDELSNVENKYGTSSDKTSKYKNEITKAEIELVKMTTSLKDNEKNLKRNSIVLDQTRDKMTSYGESLKSAGQNTRGVSLAASAALTGMFFAASNTEESVNKVNVVFGESSKIVTDFSNKSLDMYGIANSTALDMASTYGDMGTSLGIAKDEIAMMGVELVGRAGDMSSFKNISLEVANTGLMGIFTGETESLKKLGVVMTQTNLENYALAQGYKTKYQEMTEAEKVMVRYNYVMEATKNSEGDYANTSLGAANSVRSLKETVIELGSSLGEQLLPVVVPVIQGFRDMLQGFNELDPSVKGFIVGGIGVIAVLSPILSLIGQTAIGVAALTGVMPGLGAAATATIGGINAAIIGTPVGIILGAIAAGVGVATLVGNWLSGEESKRNDLIKQNAISGKRQVSELESQYYDNVTQIGYGSDAKYYVNSNAQMRNPDQYKDAAWNQKYGNIVTDLDKSTNNYNYNINVENVDELSKITDYYNNQQMNTRMAGGR